MILRWCRTIHSWTGVILLPWVVIIGATGFYLNHHKLVLSWIDRSELSESDFSTLAPEDRRTEADLRTLAGKVLPNARISKIYQDVYHGRPSLFAETDNGLLILSVPTGHYYLKTRFARRTYSPAGEHLDTKFYFGRIFKTLHETGWVNWTLGTWLADAVALAMILFGMSGLILWSTPRVRRLKRSRANR